MKLCILILAILGCSLALPSPLQKPLAWEHIKGRNVYVEPINDYVEDAPVDGRIAGGSAIAPHSVPYQVAVFIDGRYLCGGSLISNTVVLTAAHCTISASYVILIFGAHNIQIAESTQVGVTSTNIINHPSYSPSTFTNDVALIRLPNPITLNANIQTIALAAASSTTYAGSTGYITGWGSISDSNNSTTSVLRGVRTSIITNAVCQSTYGPMIQSSTLCTSGAGGVGACNGDSGGPLVVGKVQVGVASFVASSGCQSSLPTGFARVSSFVSWINQNS